MHLHYVDYLLEEILQRKIKNPRYSERAFAQSIGVSPGYLKLVLQKKRFMSPDRGEAVATKLRWSSEKKKKFLDLLQKRPPKKMDPPEKVFASLFSPRSKNFSGKGVLTRLADGVKIPYTVSTKISEAQTHKGVLSKSISLEFVYATGFQYQLNLQFSYTGPGTFGVHYEGQNVGSGFFIGKMCHLDIDFKHPQMGPFQSSVSYHFTGTKIISTGRNSTSNTVFQHIATAKK